MYIFCDLLKADNSAVKLRRFVATLMPNECNFLASCITSSHNIRAWCNTKFFHLHTHGSNRLFQVENGKKRSREVSEVKWSTEVAHVVKQSKHAAARVKSLGLGTIEKGAKKGSYLWRCHSAFSTSALKRIRSGLRSFAYTCICVSLC